MALSLPQRAVAVWIPQCFGYDAGMPVRQVLAYDLLKSVSKLEFQLRRHGNFFRSDRHGHPIPDVAWRKVEERVRPLGDAFLVEVPEWARKHLLGQRDERPMKQKIVEEEGRPRYSRPPQLENKHPRLWLLSMYFDEYPHPASLE